MNSAETLPKFVTLKTIEPPAAFFDLTLKLPTVSYNSFSIASFVSPVNVVGAATIPVPVVDAVIVHFLLVSSNTTVYSAEPSVVGTRHRKS